MKVFFRPGLHKESFGNLSISKGQALPLRSKSGQYRLGRVVTLEVDEVELVERYSLIQHISRKDRLSYKEIQVKHIRSAL